MIRDDEGFYMGLTNLPTNFVASGEEYKVTGEVKYYVLENVWKIEVSDISKI